MIGLFKRKSFVRMNTSIKNTIAKIINCYDLLYFIELHNFTLI